jgi:putative ABC transport system ATP-binding protein
MNKETVLETKNLKKRYQMGKDNFVDALTGVSVAVSAGEMVAIIGPSGSGKSTLMHMIGCLDRPDEGEVLIAGREVHELDSKKLAAIRAREIGFIFQTFNLIPTLTAAENVAVAAEYAGQSVKKAYNLACEALRKVDLGDRLQHHPSELSGGQRQRVAIARALVNKPKFVLADEPTGNLDTKTSDAIMKMLRDLNKTSGTTMVLVTHNPDIARLCDRKIELRDGEVVA